MFSRLRTLFLTLHPELLECIILDQLQNVLLFLYLAHVFASLHTRLLLLFIGWLVLASSFSLVRLEHLEHVGLVCSAVELGLPPQLKDQLLLLLRQLYFEFFLFLLLASHLLTQLPERIVVRVGHIVDLLVIFVIAHSLQTFQVQKFDFYADGAPLHRQETNVDIVYLKSFVLLVMRVHQKRFGSVLLHLTASLPRLFLLLANINAQIFVYLRRHHFTRFVTLLPASNYLCRCLLVC